MTTETAMGNRLAPDRVVWRYMSLSRFLWLLQRRQLWLSRVDKLGDPWEIALAGEQLDHVIKHQPISPLLKPGGETAMQRAARIIPIWREQTYVSCWNVSEQESHALWQIYCGRNEGVAIQSTLGKLRASGDRIPLFAVKYEKPGSKRQTPTVIDLVTQKRPMFEYEQEVRLVYVEEAVVEENLSARDFGRCLNWDPQSHVDYVRVHPFADISFMEAVTRFKSRVQRGADESGLVDHFLERIEFSVVVFSAVAVS